MLNRLRQRVRARPGLVYWLLLLCLLGSGSAPAAAALQGHSVMSAGRVTAPEHCAMPAMSQPDRSSAPDCCGDGHCDCAMLHPAPSLLPALAELSVSFAGVVFSRATAPRPPNPAHAAPQRPPIAATA